MSHSSLSSLYNDLKHMRQNMRIIIPRKVPFFLPKWECMRIMRDISLIFNEFRAAPFMWFMYNYIIYFWSPKLPCPTPQNSNGPPVVEKRQISVCKQIFIPFSYYSKNRLNISKIVPLLTGNLASNKAKQGHIIRQPSHQRGQTRSKTRRNYKIKKLFFCCPMKLLALQSFLIPPRATAWYGS